VWQVTVDCVVMYQYYLHSDRFERSSILGVCMFKGQWRADMNELRGPSPTRSLQNSVVAFLFGGKTRGRGDKCAVRNCQAIGAIFSRVRIRWRAVFHLCDLYNYIYIERDSRYAVPDSRYAAENCDVM
jgi:hypothetical protein